MADAPGVAIRLGRARDADALVSLWQTEGVHPTITDSHELVLKFLRDHADSVLVAEASGNVVGSILAAWDGWRGSLYRLAAPGQHPG